MQDKTSQPLIETLPMALGTPYTDDPRTPLNIEIPLQVALPDGQTLYAAVALSGLPFHGQQQIAERIAAAWNAFAGVATANISAPGQCLHQIQEPTPVLAAQTWPIEVTDSMALAFHRATSDEAVGPKGVSKIKEGLVAALAAAAQVVLPEPDAVIKEVMRLIADLECEAADVGYGHGSQRLVNEKRAAIESKMRALLAGVSAPAGQAVEPFGYVNTLTGLFFKDVEPCRKTNEGHWRTVFTAPQAQADARDAWQPIESAPKDGAWIQLWRTPEPEESPASSTPLVIGRWSDEEEAFVWPDDPFYDPFTAHGKESADRMVEALRTYLSNEFTHWAPLSMPSANIAAQAAAQGGA